MAAERLDDLHRLAHILGGSVLRELEEHAHILPLPQGGEQLLHLRIPRAERGGIVRLPAQIRRACAENPGHLPQLGVVRLRFLLLPVLTEGGTAPE